MYKLQRQANEFIPSIDLHDGVAMRDDLRIWTVVVGGVHKCLWLSVTHPRLNGQALSLTDNVISYYLV